MVRQSVATAHQCICGTKKRPGHPWKVAGPNGNAVLKDAVVCAFCAFCGLVDDAWRLLRQALQQPILREDAPQRLS